MILPADPSDPLATHRIQAAIDQTAAAGGGRVTLGPGLHLTGSLHLKSHIDLHLEAGARLKASPNPNDFQNVQIDGLYSGSTGGVLIQARDAEHLSISGPGTIDGSALDYMDGWRAEPYIRAPKPWRPRGIALYRCKHVRLTDFTFRDSASWSIHLTGCDDVLAHGLHILNRLDVPNCDGIGPDHCRNVRIIGCHIETRLFHPLYWGRAEPIYITAVPRHDGDPAGNLIDLHHLDSISSVIQSYLASPGITLREHVPLSTCGTFQLGGPAKTLITCGTPEALARIRAAVPYLKQPVAFIGAGSNILFADEGWPGTLIRYVSDTFAPPQSLPNGSWRVNAAIELDALAAWGCEQGLRDWEAFSGIPGTVGGAVVGNAGAWGVQMEHMLSEVHGWDATGTPRVWSVEDCGFSYRDSRLKHDGSWVSEIILHRHPGNPAHQRAERTRILALRAEKHPDWRETPCIGSFFKNIQPSSAAERRQAAGWFLEQVGAKTETEGGAAVYQKHANILIKATTDCTAADVHRLAQRLQQRVQHQFNLTLEPEIQQLGF